MELDRFYEELSKLSEQPYTNTYRMYWHGSAEEDIHWLKAFASNDETVPMIWVSNSFDYAANNYAALKGAGKGAVYMIRQIKRLNIWNPRADKDWNELTRTFPEFDIEDIRKKLIDYDWLEFEQYIRAGKLRIIERNDLLAAIQSINYDGVFNKETQSGKYFAIGLFEKCVRCFRVLDKYIREDKIKVWRSVDHPQSVYDPVAKEFKTLNETSEDDIIFDSGDNERQNFLKEYI